MLLISPLSFSQYFSQKRHHSLGAVSCHVHWQVAFWFVRFSNMQKSLRRLCCATFSEFRNKGKTYIEIVDFSALLRHEIVIPNDHAPFNCTTKVSFVCCLLLGASSCDARPTSFRRLPIFFAQTIKQQKPINATRAFATQRNFTYVACFVVCRCAHLFNRSMFQVNAAA